MKGDSDTSWTRSIEFACVWLSLLISISACWMTYWSLPGARGCSYTRMNVEPAPTLPRLVLVRSQTLSLSFNIHSVAVHYATELTTLHLTESDLTIPGYQSGLHPWPIISFIPNPSVSIGPDWLHLSSAPGACIVRVPIVLAAGTFALPALLIAFRLRRKRLRLARKECAQCGYAKGHLSVCPECGDGSIAA